MKNRLRWEWTPLGISLQAFGEDLGRLGTVHLNWRVLLRMSLSDRTDWIVRLLARILQLGQSLNDLLHLGLPVLLLWLAAVRRVIKIWLNCLCCTRLFGYDRRVCLAEFLRFLDSNLNVLHWVTRNWERRLVGVWHLEEILVVSNVLLRHGTNTKLDITFEACREHLETLSPKIILAFARCDIEFLADVIDHLFI